MEQVAETKAAYDAAQAEYIAEVAALADRQRDERKALHSAWRDRLKAGRLAIKHAEALAAMQGGTDAE